MTTFCGDAAMASELEMRMAAVDVPNVGELEVYRLVTAEGAAMQAVAQAMGLSQAAVCAGVERVLAWMVAVLPLAAKQTPEDTRLRIAEHIAVTRLDWLYGEAVAAWRSSKANENPLADRSAHSVNGKHEHGNVRYLAAAMQICLKVAKVPASLLPLASMKHSPEMGEADSPAAFPHQAVAASTSPDGDCSANSGEQEPAAEEAFEGHDVTDDSVDRYEESKEIVSAASELATFDFAPVQNRSQPGAGGQRPPGELPRDDPFQRTRKLLATG